MIYFYIYGPEATAICIKMYANIKQQNSHKQLAVFMVAPCINNIKYFIVQLINSII